MKFLVPLSYSFFYVIVLVVNYLSNALPLNGKTTGELSDLYNSMITPAGVAFSIWGFIYLLLLIFLVQVWINYSSKTSNFKDEYRGLLPFFIINAVFNITWLLAWHYELIYLSFGIMLGLLISLVYIYRFVKNKNLWLLPWSVYLGWISVATIVNASVVLIQIDFSILSSNQELFTALMAFIALCLGSIFMFKEDNIVYPLVLSWAIYWIAHENRRIEWLYYYLFGLVLILLMSILLKSYHSYKTK